MSDRRTLAAYEARAEDYAARFASDGAEPDADLRAFLNGLPPGGRVLDLGCGPGGSASLMRAAGLEVEAWDASPAMVRLARARGVEARLARFEDLDAEAIYHGVWANFSLLHAPRAALPGHLGAVARALRPGGRLHLGMKTGRGEGRDALGRFYVYWDVEELRAALVAAGLRPVARREGEGRGLAGGREPFAIWLAERPRDG